jgi:Transglutaminase-like superfamily
VKRLHRFASLTAGERRLVVRAAFFLTAFRLGLLVLPFHQLLALVRPVERVAEPGRFDPARIAWAVQAASRYVPGATCLVQALTGKVLLERDGWPASLRIGVAKDVHERFQAHAWVECRGAVVIGASGVGDYTQLMVR